jgi:hypothetical protein
VMNENGGQLVVSVHLFVYIPKFARLGIDEDMTFLDFWDFFLFFWIA